MKLSWRLASALAFAVFFSLAPPSLAKDQPATTPEERKRVTTRKAAEGKCRDRRRAYDDAVERLDRALAYETNEDFIYSRAYDVDRAAENYCDCLVKWWNSVYGWSKLPPEWDEYCNPRPRFDIEAARRERRVGAPLPRGFPPQPGAPPDLSDAPAACPEQYEAYLESRRDFQEASKGERKKDERGENQGLRELRETMVANYRKLCDCWKDMAPDLYERYCTWNGQGAPPDLTSVGKTPAGGGAPPAKKDPAPPPPPPPPAPPPAPDPNAPVPPVPGMPAPSGPGAQAADCLREGAWMVTFTVVEHRDNHNHDDCVKFLRRLLKMMLGDFLGDLFAARFEDLLPQMQCSKLPGCGGTCKGTLVEFAGRQNVQFEIQDLRRNGDTLTGKLVITSGGETLFVLKFTATPAVTA